ncbi:hypothetical protein XELAEV_18030690mg, partial [Xenopus laevis]
MSPCQCKAIPVDHNQQPITARLGMNCPIRTQCRGGCAPQRTKTAVRRSKHSQGLPGQPDDAKTVLGLR